jgi:predicted MFS family arabinose efflux permease
MRIHAMTTQSSAVRQRRQLFSGLWRHPAFMKLWIGQSISQVGSRITRDGLPLVAILIFGATPAQMGLLVAFSAIPVLLLSLIIGAWVDRLPRRPLMLAADLGRAGLLLTIPLAATTGHLSLGLLILITASTNILGLVFDVAYQSFLPVLVSPPQVLEGNSKLATTESLAEIGGPAIAGLLIQLITAPLAIAFDALSFLFSAISLAFIQVDESRPTVPGADESAPALRSEIRAGIRLVADQPLLRSLVTVMGLRTFFGSFYGTLYSLYAIRDLGLTPTVLGILIGAGGVGSLIGATLAQPLVRRFGLGWVLCGTLLFSAVIGFLTPLAGGPMLLVAGMMIAAQLFSDGAMTIYEINDMSVRQTIVSREWQGRTNATFGFIAQAVAPLGALTAGILATAFGDRLTIGIAALGGLAISLWALRLPLRRA